MSNSIKDRLDRSVVLYQKFVRKCLKAEKMMPVMERRENNMRVDFVMTFVPVTKEEVAKFLGEDQPEEKEKAPEEQKAAGIGGASIDKK